MLNIRICATLSVNRLGAFHQYVDREGAKSTERADCPVIAHLLQLERCLLPKDASLNASKSRHARTLRSNAHTDMTRRQMGDFN